MWTEGKSYTIFQRCWHSAMRRRESSKEVRLKNDYLVCPASLSMGSFRGLRSLREDQRSETLILPGPMSPAYFVIFSLQTTTQTKTTVLTYMFALCLRVDDYATDTTLVAADLAMPATKYVPPLSSGYSSLYFFLTLQG